MTDKNVCPTGFTLIELLVVIGIIVVVVAIAIPASMKAYRAAERSRTAADLQSISVGLEAFKADWGDYPRPDASGTNTGFATLGRYLIGPYGDGVLPTTPPTPAPPDPTDPPVINPGTQYNPGDCVAATPGGQQYVCVASTTSSPPSGNTPPDTWAPMGATDGYDGPGMKRPIGGRVLGPYLQADKFKLRGLAILDRQGNPILYFPAAPGKSNIHLNGGYVGVPKKAATPPVLPMYNVDDNEIFFRAANETTTAKSGPWIQMLLGDLDVTGQIDPGETEATTAPYILWSAGPDGIFGPPRDTSQGLSSLKPQATSNYDDVTNFR